jgi:hypothetical protein
VLTVEMADGSSQVRETYVSGEIADDGRFERIDEVTLVTSAGPQGEAR